MFTELERHALAYALDQTLQYDANDLRWDLIDYPVKTPTELYWAARAVGTMGRLYIKILEGLV